MPESGPACLQVTGYRSSFIYTCFALLACSFCEMTNRELTASVWWFYKRVSQQIKRKSSLCIWWPFFIFKGFNTVGERSETSESKPNEISALLSLIGGSFFCTSFCMQSLSQQHPRASSQLIPRANKLWVLWDFQLRHTELVILSLRSGMQLQISCTLYDALKSINSLIIQSYGRDWSIGLF